MEAKAVARTVRIAPRKARLVVDLIRGKQVNEALAILKHTESCFTDRKKCSSQQWPMRSTNIKLIRRFGDCQGLC